MNPNGLSLFLFSLPLTGCGMKQQPHLLQSTMMASPRLSPSARPGGEGSACRRPMAGGSPEWESSAELALAAAPWTSHRVLGHICPSTRNPLPTWHRGGQWNL